MVSKSIDWLKRYFDKPDIPVKTPQYPEQISQRNLIIQLSKIPEWEKKMDVYNLYDYDAPSGAWQKKATKESCRDENSMTACNQSELGRVECDRVNYGCGGNLIEDWLNVDLYRSEARNYRMINLLEKHPFADSSLRFGFSEDVLEHLNQAESLFFLSEIHRALVKGGVLRLSFPGLEGVLAQHYSPYSETRVRQGEFEAYAFWDHIHFYSKEELRLVSEHIGFERIEFTEYGKSVYPELSGLDTRAHQIGLNTYIELTK